MFIIGVVYTFLGFWCLFRPRLAASGLGMTLDNPKSLSEFITVYGAFEIGIGIAMIICSRNPLWAQGALVFCTIFSVILAAGRLYSFIQAQPDNFTLGLAAIELLIAAVFIILLVKSL